MTMLNNAQDYAAQGFKVLPIKARDKVPASAHGLKDATSDPARLREWFAGGDKNIGIRTGAESGIIVLDADGPEGLATIAALEAKHGPITTRRATTGGGGRHYVFKHPGVPLGNRAKFLPGLDFRGDGGYIVAPPSVHPSGSVYKWDDPLAAVEDVPMWLIVALFEDKAQRTPPTVDAAPTAPADPVPSSGDKYAAQALANEVDTVRSAPEGQRNHTLNTAAFNIGQLVGAGALERTEAETNLLAAALAAGLGETESVKTIKSGLDKGQLKPREIKPPLPGGPLGYMAVDTTAAGDAADDLEGLADGAANDEGPAVQAAAAVVNKADDLHDVLLNAPQTDAGNAEVLARLHGADLRYDHISKSWRLWSGQVWALDRTGAAYRLALQTVRRRQSAIASDPRVSKKERHSAYTYFLKCESNGTLNSILSSASNLSSFATLVEQYDANRMLVNARSVTIDLSAVTARENRREDLITQRLGTDYDPAAKAPRFLQFIAELFPDDVALQKYVQRIAGYCLTGLTKEQCLFLCFGAGRNGKTVLLNTLRAMMGSYGDTTPFETFDANGQEARSDLAKIRAARMVTISESNEDSRLNEGRVKQVTGSDPVECRELYGKPFSYVPQYKIFLAMNHLPVIRGTDNGIWRRIQLIPFNQSFDGRDDKDLPGKLLAELPGVLNWALEGLKEYYAQGLNPPPSVLQATQRYRQDSDVIGRWIEAACVVGPSVSVTSKAAYSSFKSWAMDEGLNSPPSNITFGRKLAEKGYVSTHSRAGTVYSGIGLKIDETKI